ncbi:MAG: hypothetical protein K9N49_03725 [Candidatus Marinimicrobia bacterium]|nr:hypothetical protein [Candidatus Neomarinimicrobiota bacterium]
MMTLRTLRSALAGAALATTLAALSAPAADWRLVFSDDFERAEVGPAWILKTSHGRPGGALAIADGKLICRGERGDAIFAQPVPGDVRIEWDGRYRTGDGRSMVQHALTLKANTYMGGFQGVTFVHGRNANTRNSLEFMGFRARLDMNEGPLPEEGATYHFEAAIEGRHAWMKRDGEMIMQGELPFDMIGQHFNHVMLSLGNEQMQVDNVRIYNKNPPAPLVRAGYDLPLRYTADGRAQYDGPDPEGVLAALLDRLQTAGLAAALADARALPPGPEKREALLLLTTDLLAADYHEVCKELADLLRAHPELEPPAAPGALTLAEAAEQTRYIADARHYMTRFPRSQTALWLLQRLDYRHPFYRKILLEHGRAMFWSYMESHDAQWLLEARRVLTELHQADPHLEIVRVYMGERVPWAPELARRVATLPAWAQTLRELHERSLRIIRWWGANRQHPNGALTGNWGDDVELTRSWGPITAIASDPEAVATLRRLIDGAWKTAEGGLELGYTKKMTDVEHTAEPTADTQPWLLVFDPAHPDALARNLLLLPMVRDLWTAFSPTGFRRMKSVYFTATEVMPDPMFRADVPYATRAFKGLTWLAARDDQPAARRLWLELCDGWLEATLRAEDGKLPGVVPAGVAYDTDRLGGPGPWHDTRINSVLYVFNRPNQLRILELLTLAYEVTGDVKYLEPLFRVLAICRESAGAPDLEPEAFSADWQRYQLARWGREGAYAPCVLRYRRISGDDQYDDFIVAAGGAAAYQVTGRVEDLMPRLDGLLEASAVDTSAGYQVALRYNFPMLTSEVQSSDRANIPGASTLYAAMTGASQAPSDTWTPDPIVTWVHRPGGFAALVRSLRHGQAEIKLLNFDPDDPVLSLRLWRLPLGRYTLTLTGGRPATQTVDLTTPGQEVRLELPAGQEALLSIQPAQP